jgi:hypothetical protein
MPRKKKAEVTEVKLSPEEQRQKNLDWFMKDEGKFIPEPTYHFNVNDKVTIGNLQDVTVCDIINDKIYEIDYSIIERINLEDVLKPNQRRFVAWYDIRPYQETQNTSLIKNGDIRLDYSRTELFSLIHKVYKFGVNFDPPYQREYVWQSDDKVALIDSIFNNVDIGKWLFKHNDYSDILLYDIIDGKQRLKTILDYYENRFSYNGFYYNDLCWKDRHHFKSYPVSVAEVRECNEKMVLRYFIMLNKCGRIMPKEQIEKVEKMLGMIEANE